MGPGQPKISPCQPPSRIRFRYRPFRCRRSRQNSDSLFWQFDSLLSGQTLVIDYQARLASSLPLVPFPLISLSRVAAVNDTLLANNASGVTVYRHRSPRTANAAVSGVRPGPDPDRSHRHLYRLSTVKTNRRSSKDRRLPINFPLSIMGPGQPKISPCQPPSRIRFRYRPFRCRRSGRTAIPCSGNSIRYSPDRRS